MLAKLKKEIQKLSNPKKAEIYQRFFKTNKGEYGEGDIFSGIQMAQNHSLAKKYQNLNLTNLQKLLNSKIHEHRLIALLILVIKFKKTDEKLKKEIYNFYLKNIKYINNWDLVDLSAHKIIGNYLLNNAETNILYQLAKSKNLWERRIAVISTLEFIRNNQFNHTVKISKILLNDSHDLIHKAVGWMLREMGKRDQKLLENFLNKHTSQMPRTMLRYSIEKFPEKKRKYYLKK